jgi:hypothetical protein
MRSPTPEQIAELRRDIDLDVSVWDLPGMRALVLAALDAARARVGELERYEALAFKAAERCRNEPGKCWCGCHESAVVMAGRDGR